MARTKKNRTGKRASAARANGISAALYAVKKSLNIYHLVAKHRVTNRLAPMLAVRRMSDLERERQRIAHQNGRALNHDEPATLTIEEWIATLDYFGWRCAYCGGPYDVLEHYWPIGYGHGTTVKNCLPACHQCNTLKSNRSPYVDLTGEQRLRAANFFSDFAPDRGEVIDFARFGFVDGKFGCWGHQKSKRAGKV